MVQNLRSPGGHVLLMGLAALVTGLAMAGPGQAQPLNPCPPHFLNNGQCDEPGGTGLCAAGTDSQDCSNPGGLTGQPGTASCAYALNGVCDEPVVGTGLCATGTDVADCKGMTGLPTCPTRLNGICDEPVPGGTGQCPRGTDTADCYGAGCRSTNNGVCDEPGIGTGLCAAGTDALDCSDRTSNSCMLAHNGVCNEPPNGSGCPRGTDRADCSGLGSSGFGSCVGPDCCTYAFDGQCDEPGIGTGRCAAGTDQSDCKPPEPQPTTGLPPQGMPQDIVRECQAFCKQGSGAPNYDYPGCLRQCYDMWLSTLPPPGQRLP